MRFRAGQILGAGLGFSIAASLAGCKTTALHPCTAPTAGQPAHEGPPGKGTKQCIQAKDGSGRYVNHGKYVEWYPSGKRWLQGEYKYGLKDGKWSEWAEDGKLLSEHWWEGGKLLPDRDSPEGKGPPSPAGAAGMQAAEAPAQAAEARLRAEAAAQLQGVPSGQGTAGAAGSAPAAAVPGVRQDPQSDH